MKLLNKLNPKIVNLMSSGGNSSNTITSSDLAVTISTCIASPLAFAYLYAKYQIGDSEYNYNKLLKLLRPFVYNRLINNDKSISTKTLVKHHLNLINALDDITNCVCDFITRNKLKDTIVRKYLKNIKRNTYDRHYSEFINKIINELDNDLYNLIRQIIDKID